MFRAASDLYKEAGARLANDSTPIGASFPPARLTSAAYGRQESGRLNTIYDEW